MAAQFVPHVTTAGERWDLLAWNYYGDATLYSLIIMANPQIPIEPAFGAGLVVGIPILQASPIQTNDLPPWKHLS
ncbi:MAG: tail protein X [Candidatus Binataceae bacterium]